MSSTIISTPKRRRRALHAAFGAICARRRTQADDAADTFLAGELFDDAHLAKLRYLEAVERVLSRDASDQDWALIKEHHERTPVA